MKSLKSIIFSNFRLLVLSMMVLILIIAVIFQFMAAQKQSKENSAATFIQIAQILKENEKELEKTKKEYEETCLLNAETISYIIQKNPNILGNVEEFRQLAYTMQVDEIHIFDTTGRIFTGTHPEYFNFTFDSGEQMRFFKPMMEDKSLRLCQDITPNTAEGKLVQYSALWSSNEEFIVQVGMYPDAVMESTEKNELSYIFSLLRANPGISLYAIDSSNGEIVGSTLGGYVGKHANDIGLKISDIRQSLNGKHLTVNGTNSYAVFEDVDGTLIGYITSNDRMYSHVGTYTFVLALFLLIIAIVLILMIQKFMESSVINSIQDLNNTLRSIAKGNLQERANVRNSTEFNELTDHVNHMVRYLLSNTDKLSFALSRTNVSIGIYEYNLSMQAVRFTDSICKVVGITKEHLAELYADCFKTEAFANQLKASPVPNMENTYRLSGEQEKYIRLDEINSEGTVMGVVVDVTQDVLKLKRAELDRDVDLLTGLYNRRGMEHRMDIIFNDPDAMGHGAIIAIDSDDMKGINDTYGHGAGDMYLKRHAEIFLGFDAPRQLAARVGGDEFVLLIYGYENEEDVLTDLKRLRNLQDTATLTLPDGNEVLLHFSFGYQFIHGKQDYNALLSTADEYMYNSKRIRKQAGKENPPLED